MKCINKILHGSALHKLRELESEFVDCCVTSPLYWSIVAKNKTKPQSWDPIEGISWKGELGLEPTVDTYLTHLMTIFDEVRRILKRDGSCSVVLGDIYVKKSLSMVPEKFACAMIDHGWILRSKIIWQKSTSFSRPLTKDRFDVNWESVYWFTKSRKYFFGSDCEKHNNNLHNLTGSVWTIPTEQRPKHFGFPNFPSDLVRILICKTSPKNGIVLDPFMGSGTTALVALETGRKYLGVEVSKDFINLASKRIATQRLQSAWKSHSSRRAHGSIATSPLRA